MDAVCHERVLSALVSVVAGNLLFSIGVALKVVSLMELQQRKAPPWLSLLMLLMLDLDHFKNVNDRHGHLVGDQMLQSFVRLTETCLRREDLLVRFGGEELCVLLPDTTLEGAMALAERVRVLIADTPLRAGKMQINVTVSFGVDTIREGEPGTGELLLERADQALYCAKKAGRNRVASYAPNHPIQNCLSANPARFQSGALDSSSPRPIPFHLKGIPAR